MELAVEYAGDEQEFEGQIEKDPRYKCRGIRVRLNYAQLAKQYEKFKARISLFMSDGETLMVEGKVDGKNLQEESATYPDKEFSRVKEG
jgi:hypothetical protein